VGVCRCVRRMRWWGKDGEPGKGHWLGRLRGLQPTQWFCIYASRKCVWCVCIARAAEAECCRVQQMRVRKNATVEASAGISLLVPPRCTGHYPTPLRRRVGDVKTTPRRSPPNSAMTTIFLLMPRTAFPARRRAGHVRSPATPCHWLNSLSVLQTHHGLHERNPAVVRPGSH
jgi:hypothetical protein